MNSRAVFILKYCDGNGKYTLAFYVGVLSNSIICKTPTTVNILSPKTKLRKWKVVHLRHTY